MSAVVLVVADRLCSQDQAYRPVRPVMALLAGALWPVLLVGAAQLLALHAFRGRRRRAAHIFGVDPARVGTGAAQVPTWRISA